MQADSYIGTLSRQQGVNEAGRPSVGRKKPETAWYPKGLKVDVPSTYKPGHLRALAAADQQVGYHGGI